MARVVCAFMLHIQIIPEVFLALVLMNYTRLNPHAFYGKYTAFPFLIAFMKIMAGMLTEFTNILVICQSTSVEFVIKDFIAFGFITEVDNLMVQTVQSFDIQEDIDNAGIVYPKHLSLKGFGESFMDLWLPTPDDELPLMWKLNNSV